MLREAHNARLESCTGGNQDRESIYLPSMTSGEDGWALQSSLVTASVLRGWHQLQLLLHLWSPY